MVVTGDPLRISIITPSFNQGIFLEQTIDSVLSQKYENLEYIIIDGGSTDNSVEIIKKYEKYLAYWVSEKDQGQSHAINKGFKHVTGEVINWLNSDDYYEPNALRIVNQFFQDPRVSVLAAKSNIVKNAQVIRQSSGSDIYENNLAKTVGWARIDQPETFFRVSAHSEVGPLNETLHYVMDREWWIRYLLKFGLKGIVKTNDVIANFRLHDKSKTVTEQTRFDSENEKLFVTLAYQFGVTDFAGFNNSGQIFESIKFLTGDVDLGRRIWNYYLLLRADQAYYSSDFRECARILNHVNVDLLEEKDQSLSRKLLKRSRYLPAALHRFIKRWR